MGLSGLWPAFWSFSLHSCFRSTTGQNKELLGSGACRQVIPKMFVLVQVPKKLKEIIFCSAMTVVCHEFQNTSLEFYIPLVCVWCGSTLCFLCILTWLFACWMCWKKCHHEQGSRICKTWSFLESKSSRDKRIRGFNLLHGTLLYKLSI